MATVTIQMRDEADGSVGVTVEADPPIPNGADDERTKAQEFARAFIYEVASTYGVQAVA